MMKKYFLVMMGCVAFLAAQSQQRLYLYSKGNCVPVALTDAQQIEYGNGGTTLTLAGTQYAVADIDSITFTAPTEKVVRVEYSEGKAVVNIPAYVDGVTCEVTGANVTLTSTNVTDELTFEVSGTSTAASLLYYGGYKCKFVFRDLHLTASSGAAVDIECGKRVELEIPTGTASSLQDAAGAQKACLYCDGHLELEGGGTLTVKGNAKHAVATNEYMQLKRSFGKLVIEGAPSDGIHADQYFLMNGGEVQIQGVGGDGIQTSCTKNVNDENNGQLMLNGGNVNIDVTADDVKGLKVETDLTITGGTLSVKASGKGSKCIGVDGNMMVNESSASTLITLTATGAVLTNDDGTTTKPMGAKVAKDLTIEAGNINVSHTNSKGRDIKVDGTYYAKGGTVTGTVDAALIVK